MIKIKSETASIKHTTAAACKWIWLHKELICIWCLTLIALKILKSAHQAGNTPLLAYNNIWWVRRTQGIHGWPLTEVILLKFLHRQKIICKSASLLFCLWKSAVGWLTDQSDSKAADWLCVRTAPTWWKGFKRAQPSVGNTFVRLNIQVWANDNGSCLDSWALSFSLFTHIKLWIHQGKLYELYLPKILNTGS